MKTENRYSAGAPSFDNYCEEPAFPLVINFKTEASNEIDSTIEAEGFNLGLSRLEYFAAKAMSALIAAHGVINVQVFDRDDLDVTAVDIARQTLERCYDDRYLI